MNYFLLANIRGREAGVVSFHEIRAVSQSQRSVYRIKLNHKIKTENDRISMKE